MSEKRDAHAPEESMVVRLSRLDKMLELAGEVIIVSSNLSALSHRMREGHTIDGMLAEEAKDLAITSGRISSDLHNLVTTVRTVDMSDLFARFRRVARDTSRRLGKPIRFTLEGEDVTIDKKISERIYDPIAHQIRNAIAHGIEDEATRTTAGKDPVGAVQVRVRNLEASTVVDVIDDGAGMDDESIRKKIVHLGYLNQNEASALNGEALYEYLYLPGFSTAQTTSTSAGRGVGMDVIRNVMNEVGGETRIDTKPGLGTTFSFVFPLVTAVNISDALLVRAGETAFAFPISSVVATMSVPPDDITVTTERGRSIIYLGRILPLFDLLEVFEEAPIQIPEGASLPVVIIEHKKHRAAYVVSDFMSPQKIVISEFDDAAMDIPGLSGTATLTGRQMGMVVDLPGFFEQTFGANHDELRAGPTSPNKISAATKPSAEPVAISEPSASAAPPPSAESSGFESTTEPSIEQPDSAFLNEVESMLQRLNKELVVLDEKRDTETADGIFRLVHSIKGNLTMSGVEEPAAVTHRVETILERARRGVLPMNEEVLDVLFDCASYIEEVVTALLQGRPSPPSPRKLADEIATFQRAEMLGEKESVAVDIDSAHIVLDPTGEFYLSSRRREGAPLYQCRMDFNSGDQPRFLVAYLILRRIQRVGDVIGTIPLMTDIEHGNCEGGLAVLFSPRTESPDLLERLETNLKRYYGVERFDLQPYA